MPNGDPYAMTEVDGELAGLFEFPPKAWLSVTSSRATGGLKKSFPPREKAKDNPLCPV
jgi:hypothetical protein